MRKILVLLASFIGFNACTSDEVATPTQAYETGVLVLNEGNFADNNGSITKIDRTGTVAVFDIFKQANGRSLAGGLSSYDEAGSKGIILVDNNLSGKDYVEIVDAKNFKSLKTIPTGEIENPRQVLGISETKAYILAWDATGDFNNFFKNQAYIAVLDLNTYAISKKIKLANGSQSMVKVGNEVFVGSDDFTKNSIEVVDASTDMLSTKINIGGNAKMIGLDANNKLWVFSKNELVRINTVTKMVEANIKFSTNTSGKSASNFAFSQDKKTIYFTYSFYDDKDNYKQKGETHSFSITASQAFTTVPFISRLFSGGMAVDPQTGTIYAGLIPSYKQAGYVFRFKPSGQLIDSVKAEIAPVKFFFKK
jgi:hypothetical protein